MDHKLHKTNWWESEAYKHVRDDIENRMPDYLRKIENARLELARNAWKTKPNPRCVLHNTWVIEKQLENIQERFIRWQQRFFDNGDTFRWEQMPGVMYYARFNWKAILPGPSDDWIDHIPVFGLKSDELSSNASFLYPGPVASSHYITRPDPLIHGAFEPTRAFSTGIPTYHGTFEAPRFFPTGAPTYHGTFEAPRTLHTGAAAGYDTFEHPGAFQSGIPTGYGALEPPRTFHTYIHPSQRTLECARTFPENAPTGHRAFEAGPVPIRSISGDGFFSSGTQSGAARDVATTSHADLENFDYLQNSEMKISEGARSVSHQPMRHDNRDSAAQQASAAIPLARPAAKRDRSPPTMRGVEEEDDNLRRLEAKVHKKQRVSAQQPSMGWQNFSIRHDPATKPLGTPPLTHLNFIPRAASTEGGDDSLVISKARNTSGSGRSKEPSSRQDVTTSAQQHPSSPPFAVEPVAKRTYDSLRMTSPCERISKTRRILHQQQSALPAHIGVRSEKHDDHLDVGRRRTLPEATVTRRDFLAFSKDISGATKPEPIANLSASKTASSGQRRSSDARLKSNEKHRTHHSNPNQEAKKMPAPKSPVRRPGIDARATRERIWELTHSTHLRDSESPAERVQYLQDCVEVQQQSLQLFYESSAGQRTVEYNTAFTGFRYGGSGMMCSLCQTFFHDLYGSKQDPTAPAHRIVAGASTFLKHVLHGHTAYEPSVRCEEVLVMVDRYAAFVEYLRSNAHGAEVSDLREMLQNNEVPELEFLSKFTLTKRTS